MTLDDLLRRTETNDRGCQLWLGGRSMGYGCARIGGRTVRIHRHVLELTAGSPPLPNSIAIHSCNNRACVNPSHLRWATHSDNLRDSQDAGTYWSPWRWTSDHCKNGHDLTAPGAIVPRSDGGRRCSECQREAQRRWQRANRNGDDRRTGA